MSYLGNVVANNALIGCSLPNSTTACVVQDNSGTPIFIVDNSTPEILMLPMGSPTPTQGVGVTIASQDDVNYPQFIAIGELPNDVLTNAVLFNTDQTPGQPNSVALIMGGWDGSEQQASAYIGGATTGVYVPDSASSFEVIGNITLLGALSYNYTSQSTPYSALITDCVIGVSSINASPNNTITLPVISSLVSANGHVIYIKDESGTANITNIVINTSDSATIDGSSTFTITQAYSSITLYCNGSNWFII